MCLLLLFRLHRCAWPTHPIPSHSFLFSSNYSCSLCHREKVHSDVAAADILYWPNKGFTMHTQKLFLFSPDVRRMQNTGWKKRTETTERRNDNPTFLCYKWRSGITDVISWFWYVRLEIGKPWWGRLRKWVCKKSINCCVMLKVNLLYCILNENGCKCKESAKKHDSLFSTLKWLENMVNEE